jgi:quercetin dioxygenase-like cupin family protein
MPNLFTHPAHLGRGATAIAQPEFTGEMAWYMAYSERHASDGVEGRLVALHSFTEDWTSWEMHPHGSEMVICTEGRMTVIQELLDGRLERITLGVGDYVINPPGIWHTADVEGEAATALFITAGLGTENRPRD